MGFTYHATTYFSMFFSYPTTVEVKVENTGILEFPAVTICNNNKFLKTLYCQNYPCETETINVEEIMWHLNKSIKMKLGHKKDDLFLKCKLKGRNELESDDCLNSDEELESSTLPYFSYTRIYKQPFNLSGTHLDLLLPNYPLKIKFLTVEREIETHLLHRDIFSIRVRHGNFQWIVKRSFNEIEKLHNSLQKYSLGNCATSMPSLQARKSSIIRYENPVTRREKLQQYMRAVLIDPNLRNHRNTMEFLQITPLSFIHILGHQGKECLSRVNCIGYSENTFLQLGSYITGHCTRWRTFWIIARENFISLINPFNGKIEYVMLIDTKFKVHYGFLRTGFHSHIVIKNLSMRLSIDLENRRTCKEWIGFFQEIKDGSAKDFIKRNKFKSYAPIRYCTQSCWFVDGASYFDCVANALESATEDIFIAGWWVSPEFHLKRPSDESEWWRLDNVLKRKAEQGIKIFVLLYKEVEGTLSIGSAYSETVLMQLHSNIKVLRHPTLSDLNIWLWAHHEKIIIIDQLYAFVGGLDICYGRWDNREHKLTDFGTDTASHKKDTSSKYLDSDSHKTLTKAVAESFLPEEISNSEISEILDYRKKYQITSKESPKWEIGETEIKSQRVKRFELPFHKKPINNKCPLQDLKSKKLWLGKQYTNFVYQDLHRVHKPFEDQIDRNIIPRMPWHDVSCLVTGSAARDVARHFIQRWNNIKYYKLRNNDAYPWLLPKAYVDLTTIKPFPQCPKLYSVNSQVCRSASLWSAGINTCEESIQNAYIYCITNAKYYIYIENQFFITHPPGDNYIYNGIWEAIYNRILQALSENQTFRIYVMIPLMPAFEGDIISEKSIILRSVTDNLYSSICKGPTSLLQRLCELVPDPTEYINFFSLRNYGFMNGKYVSEMVYVHSKLLIADDNTAIIGSANINDRSLLGRRDSEIAIVFNDYETVSSIMNGAEYKAGRFNINLRKRIFSEHLGLPENDPLLNDPISDFFYKQVWLKTAVTNTALYEKVFQCVPTNETTTYKELMEYTNRPRLAVTDIKLAEMLLQKIKGYLILFPLYFLSKESLKPSGRWHLYYIPDHGNCFTFNAQWNSMEKEIIYAYDSDMWNPPTELILDINVQYDEYLDEERSAAVLVTFHTPDSYPDPTSETVTARAGHQYNFGMRQTTTILLPLPYQTNCTDYSNLPWA
ncbi:phospholipase D1-like, partial [Centruroides sculpturatus]|uniref:phospholipase D1-like n=1 Tax=Centruroides sculpturatus TaxID=218467 RepID=UPI000C6EE8A9